MMAGFLPRWGRVLVGMLVILSLMGCGSPPLSTESAPLNSEYTDEQPAISGSGRYIAFVSNREGRRQLLLYDLQEAGFVPLPRLNRPGAIAETPSLSNNARYIVYVTSGSGRPEIELYDRITYRSRVLTSGLRGWVRNPSISPDGRYISFETSLRGQWDVQVLDRGSNIELDLLDGQDDAT